MQKLSKNKLLLSGGLLFIIAVAYLAYHSAHKKTTYLPKAPDSAQQANQKNGTKKTAASDHQSPTNNPAKEIPKSSNPVVSESGVNTITNPTSGSTVTSGTQITGKTTATQIYYRLKTINSGQVAGTGPISVSNGEFAFDLLFNKEIKGGTDQGTLQIYTYNKDGSEANVASVNVYVRG